MKLKTAAIYFFLLLIFHSGCQAAYNSESTPSPESDPTAAEILPTATAVEELVPTAVPILAQDDAFKSNSPLCQADDDPGEFSVQCSDGNLVISQEPGRKAREITWYRDIPANDLQQFQIQINVRSLPAEGIPVDENQYGIFFRAGENTIQALRIMNQYFSFQDWLEQDDVKVSDRTNFSFTPHLNPAGQENNLQLNCSRQICDLIINGEFSGRGSMDGAGGVNALGIFIASDWDQQFGEIHFTNLQATSDENVMHDEKTYQLFDSLTGETEIFSKAGLSGAFSEIEEDGFHFSPVSPSKNYRAITGPALENMSVEAAVFMEIDPEKSSNHFGGLICRSSLEGRYMAVIRADGTYTVYSDTPNFPLTPRLEGKSERIRPGLQENRLRLDCIGDQIDFYINEELTASFNEKRFDINYGRGGLFTKAGPQPDPDTIIFRDLTIREVR